MFSVIIPTYNGIDILRQSLPTWFDQTMAADEFEVIVVDNSSTDGTRDEVEQMIDGHSNFQYLYESQPGATAARHAGARTSKGDILVFADNDGLFNPECLQKIKEVYEGNAQCEAVTCKIELQWDGDEPEWIAPYRQMLGYLDYGDSVRYDYNLYLNGGLMSVKKSTFERLHGFNPDLIGENLIGDGDTGFVKKLFKDHCLIGYAPQAVMRHMQKVSTHGSVSGVARHYFNNGTADAYALFREQHFEMNRKMIFFKRKQRLSLFKKKIQYGVLRQRSLHNYFSIQQRKGALKFFEYLKQPELARLIKVENVY